MSYWSISQMHGSATLRQRIVACCAQEGQADPETAAQDILWQVVASPGWDAAWDSAVAAAIEAGPENATDPGMNPAVISDAQILSAVQAAIV